MVDRRERSRAVWKYSMKKNEESFNIPRFSKVVHVGIQRHNEQCKVCIWFEVWLDTKETQERVFRIYGTGHEIDKDMVHVGTVHDGAYMWHVYEKVFDR